MADANLKLRRVLIGHRGVGKTHLLTRSKAYYPDIKHFDLDYEIGRTQSKTASAIFAEIGEAEFRRIEIETFQSIVKQNENFVISCGAGFNPEIIDANIEVIFVSRLTDADGRIFLDRPRLNPELSQIEEYKIRYTERHARYLKRADKIYFLPEGVESSNEIEKSVLSGTYRIKSAIYTVQARDCRRTMTESYNFYEIRNDLLSDTEINEFKSRHQNSKLLYSVRKEADHQNLNSFSAVDCDAKYVSNFNWPEVELKIISSHEDDLNTAIKELESLHQQLSVENKKGFHFKLCPLVESFDELIKGHEWQCEDPKNRSFLPRSTDGRWIWYRLIKSYDQLLNFVKSSTEVLDQPSGFEFLTLPEKKPNEWAAVLGDPVYFSRSPEQHRTFFSALGSFFTRIKLNDRELAENLFFLQKLGLKFAAVTSPLKETLFKISDVQSSQANELKSANTMLLEDDFILVHNTDLDGFKSLTSMLRKDSKIAVWGGGGTLNMMISVLPNAHYYSSQTAERREITSADRLRISKSQELENIEISEYDFLIWAAPRRPETKWPPNFIRCKTVIDLNYTDFSMGLEYASRNKINYISGLAMFKEQAQKQQVYWMQGVRK